MNAEIFHARLRQLELDLLTLQRFAARIQSGHEDFTVDAIHPVEPLSGAVISAISAATSSIIGAVLIVDSWEKIKAMCDDAADPIESDDSRHVAHSAGASTEDWP